MRGGLTVSTERGRAFGRGPTKAKDSVDVACSIGMMGETSQIWGAAR